MINLEKLIDYLPSYFKDNDTYKVIDYDYTVVAIANDFYELSRMPAENYQYGLVLTQRKLYIYFGTRNWITTDIEPNIVKYNNTYYIWNNDEWSITNLNSSGRGILERFLEICGKYFNRIIKFKIDNILDVINIDNPKTYYPSFIEYIWEFLGKIPFAKKFGVKPFYLTEDQQKDLVRYSIPLFQKRGSKEFFETLFRIYSNDVNNLSAEVEVVEESIGWDEDPIEGTPYISPKFDVDDFDDPDINYDGYYKIKQYSDVIFFIDYTSEEQEDINSSIDAIKALIDRFTPLNINPYLIFNNEFILDDYTLVLEYYDLSSNKWVEVLPYYYIDANDLLKFRVYLSDSNGNVIDNIPFYSNINSGTLTERRGIYIFNVSSVVSNSNGDIYNFIYNNCPIEPGEGVTQSKTLSIYKVVHLVKNYHISSSETEYNLNVNNPIVEVVVQAYYNLGSDSTAYPVSVLCEQTGEVKNPTPNTSSTWIFNKPGNYTFVILENVGSRLDIVVNNFTKYYSVLLAKAILSNSGEYIPDSTGYLSSINIPVEDSNDLSNTRVLIKVICNDSNESEDNLICYLSGNKSRRFKTGDLFIPNRIGEYRFIPVYEREHNQNGLLNVNYNVISFTTFKADNSDPYTLISNSNSFVWIEVKTLANNIQSQELIDNHNIRFIVEVPDGSTHQINYGQTIFLENIEVSWNSESSIKIISSIGGSFKIYLDEDPTTKVIWDITDITDTVVNPNTVVIHGENSDGWDYSDTSEAIFKFLPSEPEAIFKITGGYINEEGEFVLMDLPNNTTIVDNNGNSYSPNEIYIEDSPKDLVFNVVCPVILNDQVVNQNFVCTLHILDYDKNITIQCLPSIVVFNESGVSIRLSITSDNPNDVVKLKLINTGDVYNSGDVFVAYSIGEYTFRAIVNGVEDPSIEQVVKVIDPNSIETDVEYLEFTPDGDPVNSDSFDIITGDNIEWVIN